MFQLRRSDSLAAFGNSTLDDDPGIGFGGDPGCQLNGYLCFEPRTQVDRPDLWEMTVYLAVGDKTGRDGAPSTLPPVPGPARPALCLDQHLTGRRQDHPIGHGRSR
jgi:hypothetical protein